MPCTQRDLVRSERGGDTRRGVEWSGIERVLARERNAYARKMQSKVTLAVAGIFRCQGEMAWVAVFRLTRH